jgi:glycosyltransferase involved in cell wall biosynthesis
MPKISVCVMTYNQESYIRQCLQSIVDQETDYGFEVVVGDDFSTDGTRLIVQEFAERYPGLVKPLFQNKNVGAFENYRSVHSAATGEYVAHVDGDDYLLPGKLTAQTRLLDRSPGLTCVFHQLRMVDAAGKDTGRYWPLIAPKEFNIDYLITHHPVVGHSSLMYRKGLLESLLKEREEFLDFRVYVELALRGQIGYIHACFGGYRVGVGVSSSSNWLSHLMSTLDFAEANGVDKNVVDKGRANQLFRAALNSLFSDDIATFYSLITKSVEIKIISIPQVVINIFKFSPRLILIAFEFYKKARTKGLVSDKKMVFK